MAILTVTVSVVSGLQSLLKWLDQGTLSQCIICHHCILCVFNSVIIKALYMSSLIQHQLYCLLCHVYYLCMPRCLETSETLKLLTTLQFKTIIVKRQTINVKDTVAKCKVKFHRNCAALCMNCGLLVMLLLC